MGLCPSVNISTVEEENKHKEPISFYAKENIDLKTKFERQSWNFENLAFEGGGVKGIAYAGALRVMEEAGVLDNIKGFAGTSAGSMVAACVGCGYTSEEITKVLRDLDFKQFQDDSWGVVGDIHRFFKEFALYKGEALKKHVRELINAKFPQNPDPTFAEYERITGHSLHVISSCIDTKRTAFFSTKNSPNTKVYEAVYASMAIPFYFKPAYISVEGWFEGKELMFVDGGMLDNMPSDVFDPLDKTGLWTTGINPNTLGLRLDSHQELTAAAESGGYHNYGHHFGDFGKYALRLYDMMSDYTSILRHTAVYDHSREIISIDTLNYSATDFKLSEADKSTLIDEGAKAAIYYLSKHGAKEIPSK